MAKAKKTRKNKQDTKRAGVLRIVRRLLLRSIILFFAFSLGSVLLFKWLPVHYTPLMLQRYFINLDDNNYFNRRQWKSLDEISPQMCLAVIASEDNNFMKHSGFDFEAIRRAVEHNKRSARKFGASTITQQTAKNVYLLPARNWLRKGLEAYFTVLIEFFWGKRRIMEMYLNVIEVGDGMYGVETAAQTYFGKPASKLTADEAALIAAILPNPREYRITQPSNYLKKRQQKIRKLMTYFKWE
jgi:monofunctional biosynthetic peptidoglycan transglycosylase